MTGLGLRTYSAGTWMGRLCPCLAMSLDPVDTGLGPPRPPQVLACSSLMSWKGLVALAVPAVGGLPGQSRRLSRCCLVPGAGGAGQRSLLGHHFTGLGGALWLPCH